jgi:transposase-like protein
MRYSQAEKFEIIRLVEQSEFGVNRTLNQIGITKSSFYEWYRHGSHHLYRFCHAEISRYRNDRGSREKLIAASPMLNSQEK